MMNQIHIVTVTYNGADVYRFASGTDDGSANAEAGEVMDRLADQFGDGFGYRVEPVDYGGGIFRSAVIESAMLAYTEGAWRPERIGTVKRAAGELRRLAAELESGL